VDGSKKSKFILAPSLGMGLKSCLIPTPPPLGGRKTRVGRSGERRIKRGGANIIACFNGWGVEGSRIEGGRVS